jgi:hypothetical protein
MKHSLQSAVLDGRLSEAFADVIQEKKARELESMRKELKNLFSNSHSTGRLAEAVRAVKEEKERNEMDKTKAKDPSSMREQLKTISVFDDRLQNAVIAVMEELLEKKKKALEELRQRMNHVLHSAAIDGRLSEALTAAAQDQRAEELEDMRLELKKTLQTSVADGRLKEAITAVRDERNSKKEFTAMRHEMRHVVKEAVVDGRLSQALAKAKNKTKAEDLDSMREQLKKTFQKSVLDGRLQEAVNAVKEEKRKVQLDALRQRMKHIFQSAVVDGRLSEALTAVAQDRKAKELEDMRQQLKKTFQSSIADGRLRHVIDLVKEERTNRQVCMMRHQMKQTFESALDDGRLFEALAARRKQKEEEAFEKMREKMRSALIQASESDQLAATLARIKKTEVPHAPQDSTMKPCKPTAAKSAARPARLSTRTSTSSGDLAVQFSATPLSSGLHAPAVSAKVSALPPRPPSSTTKMEGSRCQEFRMNAGEKSVESGPRESSLDRSYTALGNMHKPLLSPSAARSRKASPRRFSKSLETFALDEGDISCSSDAPAAQSDRDSSIARSYDALSMYKSEAATDSLSYARLSRPASPLRPLPPVTPPLKKSMSSGQATKQSAMSLDLYSSQRSMSSESAVAMDMKGEVRPSLERPNTRCTSKKQAFELYPQALEPTSKKSSTLPPIAGATTSAKATLLAPITSLTTSVKASGKIPGAKRSSSIDSFVWGVAPLKNTHDWNGLGQYVL